MLCCAWYAQIFNSNCVLASHKQLVASASFARNCFARASSCFAYCFAVLPSVRSTQEVRVATREFCLGARRGQPISSGYCFKLLVLMVKACATGHKLCVQSKGIALRLASHVVRTILLLVVSNSLLRLLRPCFATEGIATSCSCKLRLEGRKKYVVRTITSNC